MKNSASQLTPQAFVRLLKLIHSFFVVAIVTFATVAYVMVPEAEINLEDTNDPFFIIVPIVTLLCILLSKYLFKKQLEKAKEKKGLKDKLMAYQSASIVTYALFEAPAVLSIIAVFLTENLYYLIIAATLAIYFFLQKPKKEGVEADLKLSGRLKTQFQDEDKPIT